MVSRAIRVFSQLIATGFAFAFAAALLLGWLAEEVLEGETARFDFYVRNWVHSYASPPFTSAMWFFTDAGSPLILSVLIAAAITVFLLARWKRAAAIIAITVAGALLLEVALKLGFHRNRPKPYFGIVAPHSFSFPSGHALFSFALFSTAAALVSTRVRRPVLRAAIWTAAVLAIGLIGFSRIYLGVHYPTDVIAGYLTGFIWVTAVSRGDHYFRNRAQNEARADEALRPIVRRDL